MGPLAQGVLGAALSFKRATLGYEHRQSESVFMTEAKKEWGALSLPIVSFSLGWWHYFSVMASHPLGTVTDDTCLPAFRVAFTSSLY